jgi:hypothetical protein
VRLAEAPSHGAPVIKYDQASRGAIAYLALAGELVRREEERRGELQPNAEVAEAETGQGGLGSTEPDFPVRAE